MFTPDDFTLPFNRDSLEPFISKKAIDIHYDKHLGGYINNLNNLIKDTDYKNMYLYEIIRQSAKKDDTAIFNNAAQIYNHDFFFKNLSAKKSTKIPKIISDAFGGEEKFKSEFKSAAMSVFGSGWVWLVQTRETFSIITTSNAGCPIVMDVVPVLALDVWEHSYYVDYQNRRGDYIDAFLDNLVDWEKIEKRL